MRFRFVETKHSPELLALLELLMKADDPESRCDLLDDFSAHPQAILPPERPNPPAPQFDDFLALLL